jgi:UDP-N-acetylglucosamine 3-dehydrogenase
MQRINVGVIGLGKMGALHARAYSAMEDVTLAAVCDVEQEIKKKAAAKYGATPYATFEEMLKKESLNAVSICVPTKFHHRIGMAAINSRVNTLIEKPIASDVKEADELITLAKKRSVALMVGHIERFNPAVRLARELIRSNAIGKVITLSARRVGPAPPKLVGVDVVLDLAVHDIDVMRYLTGKETIKVYAESAGSVGAGRKGAPDNAFIVLKFKNGIIGTIETNWITPKKIRELSITGTDGVIELDYILQEVELHKAPAKTSTRNDYSDFLLHYTEGITEKSIVIKKEPLEEELTHFIGCVRSGKNPTSSGEDGKRALQIALQVCKSIKSGKPFAV